MNYDQNVSTSIEQFYQQLLQQKNQGKNVMGETNMLSDKYCVKNNSKELKVDMANTEMTQKNMQSGYGRKIFRNWFFNFKMSHNYGNCCILKSLDLFFKW